MDESKRFKFKTEFDAVIQDLDIEDQIVAIEQTSEKKLNEINVIAQEIKETTTKNKDAKIIKLNKLVKELLNLTKYYQCSETNNKLLEIFNSIDSKLFMPQINLIKKSILYS